MDYHNLNLNDYLAVISTLALGISVAFLLAALSAGGTYLLDHLSVHRSERLHILQKGIDSIAQRLDELEEERGLERLTSYRLEWRRHGHGLRGGPELDRGRPVVPLLLVPPGQYWVYAQHLDDNASDFDLLDTARMGQGARSSEHEWLMRQRTVNRNEVEEFLQQSRHSVTESELGEQQQSPIASGPTPGTRVIRNNPAERSRRIDDAICPCDYGTGIDPQAHGIRNSLSFSSDNDKDASSEVISSHRAVDVEDLSGSTLYEGTDEQLSDAYQSLRQRRASTTADDQEWLDDHVDYWYDGDEDPDPSRPYPPWPAEGITVSTTARTEMTLVHPNEPVIVPDRSVAITGPRSHNGLLPENRINTPRPRYRRAGVAHMTRDLENAHTRQNARNVKGEAALDGAGLGRANKFALFDQADTQSAEDRGVESNVFEVQMARVHQTPMQWPEAAPLDHSTSAQPQPTEHFESHRQAEDDRDMHEVYEAYAQHQADGFVRLHAHLAEKGNGQYGDMRGGYGGEEKEEGIIEGVQLCERLRRLRIPHLRHSDATCDELDPYDEQHLNRFSNREELDAEIARSNEQRDAARVPPRYISYHYRSDPERGRGYQHRICNPAAELEDPGYPYRVRHFSPAPSCRNAAAEAPQPVSPAYFSHRLPYSTRDVANLEEETLGHDTIEDLVELNQYLSNLQEHTRRRITELQAQVNQRLSEYQASAKNQHAAFKVRRGSSEERTLHRSITAEARMMHDAGTAAKEKRNFDVDHEAMYYYAARRPAGDEREDQREIADHLTSHRLGSLPQYVRGGAEDIVDNSGDEQEMEQRNNELDGDKGCLFGHEK